jgi:hypothetical protein
MVERLLLGLVQCLQMWSSWPWKRVQTEVAFKDFREQGRSQYSMAGD